MQKTKLGISVGLMGAGIYFMGLFSGYLLCAILVGYVFLFEENEWLKKSALKAIVLLSMLSLLTVGLNLIPNIVNFVNNIVSVFGGNFSIIPLTKLVSAIVGAIDIIQKILFIILGLKAFNQGDISIPIVDNLIAKYKG